MKILVLTQDYPSSEHPYAMAYVHSRNLEYLKAEYDVKVVNFNTEKSYIYENIYVYPFSTSLIEEADIVLSHAPNIRNHFKILSNLQNKKIVFFFHGHEVLHRYGDYPTGYTWMKESKLKKLGLYCYDLLKISLVGIYLKKISKKNDVGTIFVSRWMEDQFVKNIKFNPNSLGNSAIIPNACNSIFLEKEYVFEPKNKLADYITIRPLDDSKYAVDLVVEFAKNNPSKSFHIYGKGRYFEINDKPNNVEVFHKFIHQKDIPSLLNKYECALMPTRYDSQGVMVCEMATYGIPVITSTFEVCIEMLESFENVYYLEESEFSKVQNIIPKIKQTKNLKFSSKKLVEEELAFFGHL